MPLEARVEETDNQLVARTVAGETEAFAEIYKRYRVHLYAITVPHIRDRDEAEDIVQETMKRAFERLHTYKEANFKAWISTIARNQRKNHYRFKTVRREKNPLYATEQTTKGDLREDIRRRELQQEVGQAISKLPTEQRVIIKMRYHWGSSFKEIART